MGFTNFNLNRPVSGEGVGRPGVLRWGKKAPSLPHIPHCPLALALPPCQSPGLTPLTLDSGRPHWPGPPGALLSLSPFVTVW